VGASGPSLGGRDLGRRRLVASVLAAGLATAEASAPGAPERLTGDWGGARSELAELGVGIRGHLGADLVANLRGGRATGVEPLGRLRLHVDLDLEELLGWTGAATRLGGLATVGGRPSRRLVGDDQIVSNLQAPTALRPYEVWLEQTLGALSLRAGLLALDAELGLLPAAALFVHSSPGTSAALGASGINGPAIYPATALGARARVRLAPELRLEVAVLDGAPGLRGDPSAVALELADGALLVAEVAFDALASPRLGPRIVLGGYGYTTRREDPGLDGADRGPIGGYLLFQQGIFHGETSWLDGWGQLDAAESSLALFDLYLGGGLTGGGFLPSGPQDELGVAVAAARYGRFARATRGEDLEPWEVALELTAAFRLAPGLRLQPALQYVVNPGGVSGRPDAVVLVTRLSADL
jgi:porin